MKKVVSVTQSQMVEQAVQREKNGNMLMKKAAQGVFDLVSWAGRVAIICGSGNNGGDGYALATILHEHDILCNLFQVDLPKTEDSQFYYKQCQQLGISCETVSASFSLIGYDMVVDCIFGVGFHGRMSSMIQKIIETINQSNLLVVSVDMNSGLSAENGMADVAVRSSITISIGEYKPGHFLNMAKDYIGSLQQVDIGIEIEEAYAWTVEMSDFCQLFPMRCHDSNKGDYGKTVIMGGSVAYSGAIKLANLSCAALRSGCGLVQVVVPNSIVPGILPYLVESTLFPFPDENGVMERDVASLQQVLEHADSLAIGMGWLPDSSHGWLLETILKKTSIPIVIDAGGLNLFVQKKEEWKKTSATVILTPHLKEFSRLTGLSIELLKKDLVQYAKEFALEYHVIILLKGSTTIVTDGVTVYFSTSGCPGMAKGGSGDVLSGVLAGILSFSTLSPVMSTVAGAYIAGLAGELAVREFNEYSVLARDTIQHVGDAISKIISDTNE